MRSILITNDDGILADGFLRLAKAAQAFGTVFAVAPESQRSAASHSITLHSHIDLFPQEYPVPGIRAYACSGTPADCVRVGSLALLPVKPDVVISGINYGYNAATDLQYSATVGAAFEAAFQGIHAIALSEGASPCHEVTDAYLHEILAELLGQPLGWGEILQIGLAQEDLPRKKPMNKLVVTPDDCPPFIPGDDGTAEYLRQNTPQVFTLPNTEAVRTLLDRWYGPLDY